MWCRRACVPPVALLLPLHNRLNRVGVAALALAAGCNGSPDATIEEAATPPSGARLVVGSSLDQWNLLEIPSEGGPAVDPFFRPCGRLSSLPDRPALVSPRLQVPCLTSETGRPGDMHRGEPWVQVVENNMELLPLETSRHSAAVIYTAVLLAVG